MADFSRIHLGQHILTKAILIDHPINGLYLSDDFR